MATITDPHRFIPITHVSAADTPSCAVSPPEISRAFHALVDSLNQPATDS